MSGGKESVESLCSRQRDLWVTTSIVIVALAIGVAMVWPDVESVAVDRFGARFPGHVLLGDLLLLVFLLLVYTARRSGQIQRLLQTVRGAQASLGRT